MWYWVTEWRTRLDGEHRLNGTLGYFEDVRRGNRMVLDGWKRADGQKWAKGHLKTMLENWQFIS